MKVNFNQSLTAQLLGKSREIFTEKKYSRVHALSNLSAIPVGLVESVARLAVTVFTALPLLAANLVSKISKKEFAKEYNTTFKANAGASIESLLQAIVAVPSAIGTLVFGIKKPASKVKAEAEFKKAEEAKAAAEDKAVDDTIEGLQNNTVSVASNQS